MLLPHYAWFGGFMSASIQTNKSLMATHFMELVVDIMGFVEDNRMMAFEELIGGQKHRMWVVGELT